MAYIESFFYYIAVVMFMFVVIFGGIVFIYMLLGQLKLFFVKEEISLEIEKNFLFKLIKNRFFKLSIVAYFATFAFFYINESIDYYGSDRAYPQAKSYAIVADTVYFWHSVGVNIKINRGWGEFYRLVNHENKLDIKIQKIQTFLLDKMYQYIPEEDGERDFWYYKYKQLYVAKIRYKPDDVHNPHPRLSNIMDDMYETTDKLFNKPIKDKVFDKQRYIPIAQMAYYLADNMFYYASYEFGNDWKKMFKFMDDKKLFQRAIDYEKLLADVYEKIKTDKEVAKAFDDNPYSLGLFYGGVLNVSNKVITFYTHNGVYPCGTKEMQRHVKYIEDFYNWIFVDKNNSFEKLGSREKGQVKNLFKYVGLTANSHVANYICDISFDYIEITNIPNYKYNLDIIPNYQNDKEFIDDFPTSYYTRYIDITKLLEQKRSQKEENK